MARHVEVLRPRMQCIVDGMVDRLLEQPQPVDLIKAFALRTDGVLDRSRTAAESEMSAIELMGYFDRMVTAKEQTPGDDILGRLMPSSANRDESAFMNPDAFDSRRDSRNHVGFGTLRLAGTIEELPFRHEMVLYGLKALPVTWSAAGGHSYTKEG